MISTSPTLLAVIERVINQYLSLDPEIATQFGELEGKKLLFTITAPALQFYCLPRTGSLVLKTAIDTDEDCQIQGSALGLLKMSRSDSPAEHLNEGGVKIMGDSRVAQRFSDILGAVEIDWEEMASKVVGDFAAYRLGTAVRQANHWVSESIDAVRMDSSEYLQEESGILPTPIEIDEFMTAVDNFRSDVDRLEARIKRLERQTQGKTQ